MLSSSSSHHPTTCSKIPEVVISPPLSPGAVPADIYHTQVQDGRTNKEEEEEEEDTSHDASKDYEDFLAKAKKEAEKEAKEQAKKAKKAREVNMSPWASRMNC